MNKFIAFLKDVKVELAKVSWPTKEQTIKYSLVVVGASLILALFLGGLDSAFLFLLNKALAK
jgi:preprotein translocase subunit SecE